MTPEQVAELWRLEAENQSMGLSSVDQARFRQLHEMYRAEHETHVGEVREQIDKDFQNRNDDKDSGCGG